MRTAIDTLFLHDPEFEGNANAFKNEVGGTSATHPVTSIDTLKQALDSYSLVKFLVVLCHGSPGRIWLPSDEEVDGMDFWGLGLLPDTLLRRDARVLFYGCNLGAGTEGDTFLDDFGRAAFRGKGGTVGASTVTNFTWSLGPVGLADAWMSLASPFAARLKVVRYNQAGNRTDSLSVNRWGTPD
jgi:hypothetical protein